MEPHDNECTKDIEGTVTSITEQLLFFTLDHQYNVYVTMDKSLTALPAINDKVTIANAHCISNDFSITTYYLCSRSTITVTPHEMHIPKPPSPPSSSSLPEEELSFLDQASLLEFENPMIIDEEPQAQSSTFGDIPIPCYLFMSELFTVNSFGLRDLRQIDHSYHTIKKYFGKKYSFIKSEEVVEWLIPKLLNREVIDCSSVSCSNRLLPHFQVKTISDDCNYVDVWTKKGESRDLHYWGFGTYYYDSSVSNKKVNYIFGYLFVHVKYGMVMVEDDCNCMAVIMRRDQTSEMSDFIDCLVLIKKYCVITEFHQSSHVKNLQYMLLDPADLEIVTRNLQKIDQYYHSSNNLSHSTEIEILSISSIMYNYEKTCEYWIEVENCTMQQEKALICMSGKGIEMKPFLQTGLKYKALYNFKPSKNDPILSKLLPYKQYKFTEQSRFVPESKVEANSNNDKVMDVKTCLNFMKTNGNASNSLISFRGKIMCKKFCDPLPSRSARKIDEYGFGTPGYKTHYLEFLGSCGGKIKLYLNNWESLFIPLGLIPDMIVTVRNVANQKGQYCKSTALTSFEIIDYNPSVPFQSVNLCTEIGEIWGRPFFLSLGHSIPVGVLIWCPVNSIYIKSLKISVDCAKNCVDSADVCDSNEFSFKVVLAMNVMDVLGEATLINKSINLLQVLMDYSPDQFVSFLEALHEIKTFEYDRLAYLTRNEEVEYEDIFRKSFSKMITCISCIVVDFHFYCRKLGENDEKESGNPLWYCLKARKGSENCEAID